MNKINKYIKEHKFLFKTIVKGVIKLLFKIIAEEVLFNLFEIL